MREFIITLIGVAVVSGGVQMLCPEDSKASGLINIISGLCIICIMLAPLKDFIAWMRNDAVGMLDGIYGSQITTEDYAEIYEKSIIEGSELKASQSLKLLIITDLELSEDSFDVSLRLTRSDEEYCAESVTVFLYDKAVLTDPKIIKDYVARLLSCECQIVYKQRG